MIVRRIAQHLKQQHWTGVAIELVIVVLGVFIGLQVDNCRQARSERSDVTASIDAVTQPCHPCGKLWLPCQGGLMDV